MRASVLQADALGLGRKFQAFTLDHLDPSFFRAEAVDVLRAINANALPHALTFAYQVRSRQVHALERLAPEMWMVADRADTISVDGRQVLSLEGLNRLCRHVIRHYVDRAPTGHDASFDYRRALPGIVRVQLAPEYWISRTEGLRTENVPAVLAGFLEMMLPVLRGDEDVVRADMRGVLERIEALLPGEASPAKRAPLVALYALWHRLLPAEGHRPDPDAALSRFGGDLDTPSAAAFAARLILTGDVPWPTDELTAFASARAKQLRRGKAEPLPAVLDAALELCLARRLWQEGRAEDALAAVARAVETIPGDERLIAFQKQAHADTADTAGLATLDVRALLLYAPGITGDPTVDTSEDSAEQAGKAANNVREATPPPAGREGDVPHRRNRQRERRRSGGVRWESRPVRPAR